MKEHILHYIWKHRFLGLTLMKSEEGQDIIVRDVGIHNHDAGPDFLDGSISIGQEKWYGHIEIHVNGIDWRTHGHNCDPAYNNVILHVVWNKPVQTRRKDGSIIPTLSLSKYVNQDIVNRYMNDMKERKGLLCQAYLADIPKSIQSDMLTHCLFARLDHRFQWVQSLLACNLDDTEEVTYQVLAYAFGFRINSRAFLDLATRLPLSLLKRHINNILHLEALLLGVAGLLPRRDDSHDPYVISLIDIYRKAQKKYRLPRAMKGACWSFFRSRPSNFPTLRIAQFAMMLHKIGALFDQFLNLPLAELRKKLMILPSPYWQTHYRFSQSSSPSRHRQSGLGKKSVDQIIINTVVPLLVSYGKLRKSDFYTLKAIDLLSALPSEKNKITNLFIGAGMPIKHAGESQGALHLWKNYCQPQKCLSCQIGAHIIGSDKKAKLDC